MVIYLYILPESKKYRREGIEPACRPRDTFLKMCIETHGRSIEKHIKGIINQRLIIELITE